MAGHSARTPGDAPAGGGRSRASGATIEAMRRNAANRSLHASSSSIASPLPCHAGTSRLLAGAGQGSDTTRGCRHQGTRGHRDGGRFDAGRCRRAFRAGRDRAQQGSRPHRRSRKAPRSSRGNSRAREPALQAGRAERAFDHAARKPRAALEFLRERAQRLAPRAQAGFQPVHGRRRRARAPSRAVGSDPRGGGDVGNGACAVRSHRQRAGGNRRRGCGRIRPDRQADQSQPAGQRTRDRHPGRAEGSRGRHFLQRPPPRQDRLAAALASGERSAAARGRTQVVGDGPQGRDDIPQRIPRGDAGLPQRKDRRRAAHAAPAHLARHPQP